MKRKLAGIPKDLLEDYKACRLTSKQLAALTGYTAGYLRAAIRRPWPRSDRVADKAAEKLLRERRRAYRASLAHLPLVEIERRAHVSRATASRIRRMSQK